MVDGHAEIIAERCVECGACVVECGNGARVVRDDLPRVRELLAGEAPVVALLASEYIAAMHPLAPAALESALRGLGFDHVESTVVGEEIAAAAYEQIHASGDIHPPRLRSTCPVAVDWVRRFHPALTGALVPLMPPYVAQAQVIRAQADGDVAIVYVSPCWARKDEVLSPEISRIVDVAIGFDELKRLIEEGVGPEDRKAPGVTTLRHRKELSATDGFPRRTLERKDLMSRDVAVVRGLRDIDRLMTAIARGEAFPSVVDMLNCESCIDGPCVSRSMSVYAKRNIDLQERERMEPPSVEQRAVLASPPVDLRRSFTPAPVICAEPTEEEIDRVLAAGEFLSRDHVLDCGACGYDRCVEHAAAIWLGNSSWDACFPLVRKRLERERERCEAEAATDELTGLFNRRAFDLRLSEEVVRAQRYEMDLSLVMMDLDGFKQVNDSMGHGAGDMLLTSVGVLLKSQLRAADVAFRYGGDEFALVLTNTSETDAWVVAEKLRSTLRSLTAYTDTGMRILTTASFGVASFGGDHTDAASLLAAADAALYRAKRSGRDRVEVASGVSTS